MTTPSSRPWITPTKVALFITSSTPFPEDWVKSQCRIAEQSAESSDGRNEPIRLEQIPGNFEGWTPFKLARDYVYPQLCETPSPFAYISFVVLDDKSHDDKRFLIVGVHPDSFEGGQLEIEATSRMEADCAVDLPIIFHYGTQGITSYPCDRYDNEAERNSA